MRSGTASAILAGAVGLDKTTAGTVTLSGANTYTGTTTISAGTLRVAGGTAIADTSAVVLANVASATLDLNGTNETIGTLSGGGGAGGDVTLGAGTLTITQAADTTYAGTISGSGGITKTGANTLTLSRGNIYSGTTTIQAGTLSVANAAGLGTTAGGTTVDAGGTLQIASVAVGAEAVTLNGGTLSGTGTASLSGAVSVPAGSTITAPTGADTLTVSGTVEGAGALNLTGAGTVTLGGTVGNTTAPASLTQSVTTALNLNGGLVRTSGSQTYNGATTIGAVTTLRTTGGGGISAPGAVTATAGTLTLDTGSGAATFNNVANDFGTVAVTSGGAVTLVDSNAMTLGASSVGTITARTLSGDLTLGGSITASGSGDAIVLAAAGDFDNSGLFTLTPGTGRWLVYTSDPALVNFGGLSSGNPGLWNRTYAANPPASITQSGNRYLFGTTQTLTFTSGILAKTYGDDVTGSLPALFTVSGANTNTYGGAIVADSSVPLSSLFSGAPSVTSAGAVATANVTGSPYAVAIGAGTLSSLTGYGTSFGSTGTITINPKAVNLAGTRVYDSTTNFTAGAFTPTISATVGGDTLTVASGTGTVPLNGVAAGTQTLTTGTLALGDGTGLASNYTLSGGTHTGTIMLAALNVTADDKSRPQGTPNPPFTATYGGFQAGETPAVLTGTLSLTTPATVSSPAGSYSITPFGQTSTNYAITYVNGTLTVGTSGVPSPGNATTPSAASLSTFINPVIQAVNFWVPDLNVVAYSTDESTTALPPTAAGPADGAGSGAQFEEQPSHRIQSDWQCLRHSVLTKLPPRYCGLK